jgi:hypothetical protein
MSTTPYDSEYDYLHWNGNNMMSQTNSSDQSKVNKDKKTLLTIFVRYSLFEGFTDQSIDHNHQELMSSPKQETNYYQYTNYGQDLSIPFDDCIVSDILRKATVV